MEAIVNDKEKIRINTRIIIVVTIIIIIIENVPIGAPFPAMNDFERSINSNNFGVVMKI